MVVAMVGFCSIEATCSVCSGCTRPSEDQLWRSLK